ncbi:DMT family transporter [Candidatus Dependentiae bacterium]|nr:DMT family transporter [Candidatus Dependentiae bacterium]
MVLLLVLMNVVYALLFPISKIALEYTSALFLTGFRMTLAGLLVLGYQYFFNRKAFTFPRAYWLPLAAAAFTEIYLTNILDFWGFYYMSSTKSCFLYNLYPFTAAFLAYFFLSERLTKRKWLGLFIGFAGSLPMILTTTVATEMTPVYKGFPFLPELAVIAGIITNPLGWIIIRKIICENNYNATMANGISMFLGGLMALVHSLCVESWHPIPVANYKGFFISSLSLMLLSNVIGNSIYVNLLVKYSVTFLSFTAFSEPLLVALLDWVFFGLKVPYAFYISLVIVCCGLYVFYKDELSKKRG